MEENQILLAGSNKITLNNDGKFKVFAKDKVKYPPVNSVDKQKTKTTESTNIFENNDSEYTPIL